MVSYLENLRQNSSEDGGIPFIEMHRPYVSPNRKAEVGIELEVEGHNLPRNNNLGKIVAPKSGSKWQAKEDGSLRGEALEYVLREPCFTDEVDHMLDGLWSSFNRLETHFSISNRCSTHVHVNVGGLKVNELTSIIALWTTFEEALIKWCGEDRETNHFCLSSKDSETLIDTWKTFLTTGHLYTPDGCKYSALNIRPMHDFGSFEFRTMRMDKNKEVISNWVKFIHALVSHAVSDYPNPQRLTSLLSEKEGLGIFTDICEAAGIQGASFFEEVVSSVPHFNKSCLDGFRRVQPLVQGFPWYQWMPLIEKEPEEEVINPFNSEVEELFRGLQGIEAPPNPEELVDFTRPLMFPDGTRFAPIAEGSNSGKAMAPVPRYEGWRDDLHLSIYNYDRRGYWSGNTVEYIMNVPRNWRYNAMTFKYQPGDMF